MNQSQKEFEAWHSASHWPKINNCLAKQVAWQSWCASRAAMVVELPKQPYYDFDIDLVHDALDAAGVKYK
jgi:hypothetical protein